MSTEDLEDEFAVEAQEEALAVDRSLSTSFLISLMSGITAGLLTTIVCAPFDVVKIRLQVQGSIGVHKYAGLGTLGIMKKIYREEKVPGLFRGLGPAMFTIPFFWGVYWPIYDRMKFYFKDNYSHWNEHTSHMTCAIIAGCVSDIATNPFWVTRTRIQTLALHSEVHLASNISTFGMMKVIFREEGILAFYRGLGASFLGLAHVALQFPLCKRNFIIIFL
jgi:solute carrier family 25 folate transporter 32